MRLYYAVGRDSSFPVDFSPCLVLSAIVSRLFVSHDHLQICGRQDIASALVAEDSRWATNSFDLITLILSYLGTNFYANSTYIFTDIHTLYWANRLLSTSSFLHTISFPLKATWS